MFELNVHLMNRGSNAHLCSDIKPSCFLYNQTSQSRDDARELLIGTRVWGLRHLSSTCECSNIRIVFVASFPSRPLYQGCMLASVYARSIGELCDSNKRGDFTLWAKKGAPNKEQWERGGKTRRS